MSALPKLYAELADWWPLLSSPAEYEEEAAFYSAALTAACDRPPETVLELGSGGGNNASHMKRHFRMTLVDPSPGMLAVSRVLNPDLEHVEGDMRTVRLGRQFDAVFIHDAVVYMTSEADVRRAIETARVHCRARRRRPCLRRITCAKRSARRPITAATMDPRGRSAISNGPGIPIRPTTRIRSTTHICFATTGDWSASSTIGTTKASSHVTTG